MDLNKIRKGVRIGTVAFTSVLTMGVSLAAAAPGDLSANNDITGYNSSNTVKATSNASRHFNANNVANTANSPHVSANTGNNNGNNNTGPSRVTGGSIMGTINTHTASNFAMAGMGILPWGGGVTDVSTGNSNTGSQSTNNATATSTDTTTVHATNTASTGNNITGEFTTGKNHGNNNTGASDVMGGSADVAVSASTDHNANAGAAFAGVDGGWVDPINVSTENNTTGANSKNNATSTATSKLEITENNTSSISNTANLKFTTGNNEANNNTGAASSTGGDATFSIDFTNTSN